MRLRSLLDAALALAARAIMRVFFREAQVVGAQRVPRGQPLLVVANHENNLIDPLVLLAFTGVRPRFLAKSTLFSHPVVGPLLVLAGALPVHRRQDPGADPARNLDTFVHCAKALAEGGAVALFPEGTSHNRPHRLPLKTGAARIALEAEARHGPLGLRILPVGITYDDKASFRSRVLVQIGPPLDPSPEVAVYAQAPRRAVGALTERLASALEEVTLNYASWEEARLVGRAAALLAEAERPGDPPTLSDLWAMRERVWHGYEWLKESDPGRAAELAAEVARYDQTLADLRLAEGQGPLPPAFLPATNRQGWRLATLALLAPAALVGLVLNWLPYRVPGWIVARRTRTPDEPATYKVVASLLFFPLTWLLEAALAARLFGPLAGALALLAAPVTGYAALVLTEQLGQAWERRWRARLAAEPQVRQALQQRARLRDELSEAAGLHRRSSSLT